jgi:uncharacterized membrane protein
VPIKDSPWVFLIGGIIGAIDSILWFILIRQYQSKEATYILSTIWDIMITLIFLLIPLFFHIQLGKTAWIGIILCAAGLITLKAGS